MDLNNICVGLQTDASLAQQPKGGSQLGFLVVALPKEAMTNTFSTGPCCLLEWGSKRIHRVVRSTLAAEAAAMAHGYDRAVYLRALLGEVLHGCRTWKHQLDLVPQTSGTETDDDVTWGSPHWHDVR
jgi:hypothetical protein